MSTFVKLLPRTTMDEVEQSPIHADPEVEQAVAPSLHTTGWTLESFAEEQIRGLVRQVFLPGWPRPCRQVVFSPVDPGSDISPICMQVGQTLADEGSGEACVVEACPTARDEDGASEDRLAAVGGEKRFGTLRDLSQQLSGSLWFMPRSVFLGGNQNGFSTAWLRARLAELRLEFDYTVLQGPAAGAGSEAALLGATCDGLVLVLQANATRRATAQRVKETLHSANARLLGTVLSERTFPIPRAIYRRL
ncbi:hypothetical protein SBA1_1170005 [Candidatus Sulfotelmatobacter kueseliae]|uniref:Uncharacterized protein n=1 Tax=Candidatus Sulfotelmatobacter kueseliae TaxID=2042962 RepID=A0A2U3K164_9BACT|nr:hypothetical protein SBA1_1170005 [Candidatus Sulfotelmatobacter kueseliae]